MTMVLYGALGLLTYFAWAAIHELCHFGMAKKLLGAKLVSMKLYPHMSPEGWRWAGVAFSYRMAMTAHRQARISLAPRLADFAAVVFLPIGCIVLTGTAFWAWSIFWGGGIVDLANGSLGITKHSDLQRSGGNPWLLRSVGWSLVLGSAMLWWAIYASH